MTSTPVGMRCPECAGEKTRVVNPIGAPGRSDAPATYAIIGACVLAFIAEIAGGGSISGGGGTATTEGGLFAYAVDAQGQTLGVAGGQPYRLVTSAFLHAGLLHLGLNMFALYILGTLLEPAIGTVRFVGIYAVSVLGGSFLVMVMDPNQLTVGASGGIFGLMAAAFLIARHRGLDELASQIGFFVIINLVFTFSISAISDRRPHRRPRRRRARGVAAQPARAQPRRRTRRRSRSSAWSRSAWSPSSAALIAAESQRAARPRLAAPASDRRPLGAQLAPQRLGGDPRRRVDELRVEQVGEQLDAVDQPRARARERRGRVDGDDPLGAERAQRSPWSRACAAASARVQAARHHDDDLGASPRPAVPTRPPATSCPASPSTSSPPAAAIISGTQWPPM